MLPAIKVPQHFIKGYLFTGLKRSRNSKPSHRKRLQGAADARRRARRRTLLYFKCPGTKQMRCLCERLGGKYQMVTADYQIFTQGMMGTEQ